MSGLDGILVALLAGGAALLQALTGFGFSLLIVPPLSLVIGPKDAVVVANVLSASVNVMMLTRVHAGVQWRTAWSLLAAATVGMPLGLLLLIYLDSSTLQLFIAGSVLLFTALLARGLRLHDAGAAGDAAAGFLSGVFNTSTSMSGPPVVVYLQGKGLSPDAFRATLTAYFLASSAIAVGLLALTGRFDSDVGGATAVALPALAVGFVAGNILYRLFNEQRFRTLVLATLAASALLAIVAAVFR
jgi:uncharacterized membrane protein YfcA